ncbi:MAG: HlyD family efflux transporter periplasmic adaptor subunit [Chitinophagaceae bacterium]|nr:HlyD family efflux transporter periplasmic adaptor subunit [Chitinophagaceae bacterium]
MQTSFQEFATSLRQLDDYLTNGFYIKKKESILNDVKTFEKISNDLENERLLIIEDTLLSQHTFDMNEKLRKQSVISEEEYRTQRMKLLSKRMAIPRVNSNILNNENQRRTKLKELDQLNHDFSQQRTIFEQDLNTLKSKIRDWINNYSIIASTNGVVSFNQLLQQNQFLKQGSVLGYISPIQSDYLIQVYLPQFNLGKVDTGMNVLLRFDAYPYQELGFLRGKVNYISKIAQDSGYLATIRLTNGLVTNQKKEIVYRSGLKADALIITKNRRLLDLFLASVTKLTSK